MLLGGSFASHMGTAFLLHAWLPGRIGNKVSQQQPNDSIHHRWWIHWEDLLGSVPIAVVFQVVVSR